MHSVEVREKNVPCEHFSLVPIHFWFLTSLGLFNILTKFTASQFGNHAKLGRARKERSMWTLHLGSHPFLFLCSAADHLVTWHKLGTGVHIRRVAGAVEILWSTGLVAFLWNGINMNGKHDTNSVQEFMYGVWQVLWKSSGLQVLWHSSEKVSFSVYALTVYSDRISCMNSFDFIYLTNSFHHLSTNCSSCVPRKLSKLRRTLTRSFYCYLNGGKSRLIVQGQP